MQLPDDCAAARDLLALAGAVNQAVGDALSGLLLVEAALRRRGWGLDEWGALYADLPSRQLKVSRLGYQTASTPEALTSWAGMPWRALRRPALAGAQGRSKASQACMTAVAHMLVCISDPLNSYRIVTVGTVHASRILMALLWTPPCPGSAS